MKYFLIILALISVVYLMIFSPVIEGVSACYQESSQRMDAYTESVSGLAIPRDQACSDSSRIIENFRSCLVDVGDKNILGHEILKIPFVSFAYNDIAMRHNNSCNTSITQF